MERLALAVPNVGSSDHLYWSIAGATSTSVGAATVKYMLLAHGARVYERSGRPHGTFCFSREGIEVFRGEYIVPAMIFVG